MENLRAFRTLCRQLLAEGIIPTATEFARRGWPYVNPACDRLYHRNRRPIANPGSGTTWTQGRYTTVRREELIAAGYVFVPGRGRFPDVNGRWVKQEA